ncbi:alcohol dehydrogenase class IV [Melghiribacillus thermohalophilus]|uniref:Alcohol dehydrogenase class IV n=1 Tax=Melghiribacillus thermohalophilus TaxID=1324956 RepID=A0A4R3N0M8_9BACI|nr:alcohol dehydrogenase class IV [Melghiribacillus thermohalophilus]
MKAISIFGRVVNHLISHLYFPNQIRLGAGSLKELGEAVQELQASHMFIVISLSVKKQVGDAVRKIARDAGLKATFFSDYKGEPNTHHVQKASRILIDSQADCVVAIGGGSAIDLAKAVAAAAKNPAVTMESMKTLADVDRFPLIAIPTTAGTGSEVTKISVITDEKTRVKINPGHPRLIPDIAILDPALTVSLPKPITAFTGMDALAHAMEAYVSTLANPISDVLALEAMSLIGTYLPAVYEKPDDLEAREKMLLASSLAGIAFSNASTNLAHAAARPLGARFHIPHGLSVALVLPYVMEFGLDVNQERYQNVARALDQTGQNQRAEDAVAIVKKLNQVFNLYELGKSFMHKQELVQAIPQLVRDALSGNGIQTNRKLPNEDDVTEVYARLIEDLF